MSSTWETRVTNGNRYYEWWESRFKCKTLEQYYEGFQWQSKREIGVVNYNPYTINMFYSTIKIKLSNFLFQRPSFILSPKPGNSQWNLDFAVQSSLLKQDVLNAIIQNPNTKFNNHMRLAALDSFFRFGVMEVGYAADWRNPLKEDPLLKSHNETDINETEDKVKSDYEVPINERFYVKRIPAKRFRVGVSDATDLNDQEWCGYYEYFYTNTLKKTKGLKWPLNLSGADISQGSGLIGDASITDKPEFTTVQSVNSIVKCWHLWDLVSHERLLFLDKHFDDPLWVGESERLPIIDIRWDHRLEGFYPIPPSFQWISPQDEINEAREQTRSYRRRFTRKFQAVKGSIDEEEKEKFASGPDGVIIEVKTQNAISSIDNPDQNASNTQALMVAKDDFNIISGTSSEARGTADRETATQSRIKDVRSQIRESADQLDFSNFLCLIGREILAQASVKLVEGMWVKYSSNPTDKPLQDMQVMGPVFKYVTGQELSDGYDFEVELDVQNATPAAMQQAQQAFMSFIALIQQSPMLSMSPILIREAAYRCGYRNEQVIQQMQQVAILSMAAKVAQQSGGQSGQVAEGNPNNAAKEQLAQEATPTVEQTDQQIQQQLT